MSFLDALLRPAVTALATTGAPVNVSDAAPPTAAGDVLQRSADNEHAAWGPLAGGALGFFAMIVDVDASIAAGSIYRVDCTSNAVELTLPDGATHGARLGVKITASINTHLTTITMGGVNTIEADGSLGLNASLTLDSRYGSYYEWVFDAEANGNDGAWWLLNYLPGKTGA